MEGLEKEEVLEASFNLKLWPEELRRSAIMDSGRSPKRSVNKNEDPCRADFVAEGPWYRARMESLKELIVYMSHHQEPLISLNSGQHTYTSLRIGNLENINKMLRK